MGNDSGDRSNQVQDGENDDNEQKNSNPVSLERHRNEEKDYLANRTIEQMQIGKRMKKSRKQKVSTSGEDSKSLSNDSSHPAKKKKKAIRRQDHQPTPSSSSTASDSSSNEESWNDRFKIIIENEKKINGNYPKV